MMTPCVDLPLPVEVLRELVEKAKDWALMHGVLLRSKTNFSKDEALFAPFALLPSSFPRKAFENTCEIQLILNKVMHAAAHDYDFLKETLNETIQVDSFTAKLFEIYETVREEGFTQKVSLGLLRSDLMLESCCVRNGSGDVNKPFCCWKQVEINTIASGFGWLGPSLTNLHRYILKELGLTDKLHNIPENKALEGLCGGMIEAWNIYNDPKCVLIQLDHLIIQRDSSASR